MKPALLALWALQCTPARRVSVCFLLLAAGVRAGNHDMTGAFLEDVELGCISVALLDNLRPRTDCQGGHGAEYSLLGR